MSKDSQGASLMSIKLVVNTAKHYKSLQEEFNSRIDKLHVTLEQLSYERDIQLCQGQILELRKLLKLREEVNGRSNS